MAAFNKFNAFVEALAHGVHDLGSDTLKVYLTNTPPNAATHAVKADLAEIAAGNGYTAGGAIAAISASAQSGGIYKLVLDDPPVWTAAGGPIGPFQFAVLYNDGADADELIGWWDYQASITIRAGESFRVDFDPTLGVLTLV